MDYCALGSTIRPGGPMFSPSLRRRLTNEPTQPVLLLCGGQRHFGADDALVQQCPNHDAAILRQSFGGLVTAHLSAFTIAPGASMLVSGTLPFWDVLQI